MKLTFNITYHTNWGESVFIVGSHPKLGDGNEDKALKMDLKDFDSWSTTIELDDAVTAIEYHFIVKAENGYVKHEWGKPHRLMFDGKISDIQIFDHWQDQPYNKHYYSSAFVDSIFHRNSDKKKLKVKSGYLYISIAAPHIEPDEYLAVCGDCQALGAWDVTKAVALNDSLFPYWTLSIPMSKIKGDFQYKFIILKKETNEIVAWENSSNRTFSYKNEANEAVVLSGLVFNDPKGNWRGAGVAIPVFSLRSKEDMGVGDFYDLFNMIDWAKLTGQNFVQILPINDTTMTGTWTDSYPYNANSTFALHPMFLRVNAIGTLKDAGRMEYYKNQATELNALPQVDYERVNNLKAEYVREIFSEIGKDVMRKADFKKFVENNSYWLKDYAAFCVLRDKFGTPDFSQWKEYQKYDAAKVGELQASEPEAINLVYFTQYFLDKQLSEVRNYAHEKTVVLKGDIPIGISRTSVDAWVNPRLFNLDCQAGAPPDDFSVLGQNWGFPTYNWEEMNKDGFKWWKDRFKKMSEYFDAYRIDHILGFFRIWQIPMDAVHGLLGTFNPALPYTEDEMRNNYDFWLNYDLHTKPYIMNYFLTDFFGEYTDEVKHHFLDEIGYGRYGLKEFVNTQKKVVEYFSKIPADEKNNKVRDALLGLIDQVLFIEDKEERGKFHPRISAQFTYTYRSLNDYERWCFDRLYNDFFYHRHNDFWYGKAMWKLPPLINSTDMLVCGEDLGMIPDCVSAVMNSQQILSLEIQRMPKDPTTEFGNTWAYPYLSVCTTSTHDMGGIRLWWEEDREKTQHFYNNVLHENGLAPYYAEPWICDRILSLHLDSPGMLAILPWQDWMSMNGALRRENPADEQINIPAISRHYWRYRMHINLEDMLNETDFNEYIKSKIQNSGR